jgi:hypothetical protein
MASFVVMQGRSKKDGVADTVLIRDEFSFVALILPFFWLLWHRLWFAALLFLLVSVGIALAADAFAASIAMAFVNLAIGIFVALEGPAWRIARFRRLDYAEAGTISADDMFEAELRWFGRDGAADVANPAVPPVSKTPVLGRGEPQDLLLGFGSER